MIQSAYELRFKVYCIECGFLPSEQYPEERESDQYDEESAHFFSYNRSDELVGYARLVPADPEGRFPWQDFCSQLLDGVTLPNAAEVAEVSRLMVRRDYRRRRGDLLSGVTATESASSTAVGERRVDSPRILLNLYRQMYQYCLANGIRYWYAAMERPLARSLRRMDFNFQQVGALTDYYGIVAPYLADLRQLETELERTNSPMLAWFRMPDGRTN